MPAARTLSSLVEIDLELPHAAVRPTAHHEGPVVPQHEHIAQAAYYLAQARGFAPGADLDDWLAAEQQIAQGYGV